MVYHRSLFSIVTLRNTFYKTRYAKYLSEGKLEMVTPKRKLKVDIITPEDCNRRMGNTFMYFYSYIIKGL
ncbi:hypothetical protein MXB_5188 [Myxobolus squamalis]|nr:hypothetical protein MXB_5188 [Myxobolus squamalis]